jgi:hypothetical protein
MTGVRQVLERDHVRLDDLLTRADAAPSSLDAQAYEAFRGGLLRHIAMEEKVLLPEARRLWGGEPLEVAKQLRADHAALAALLVPTPNHEIIASLRNVLAEHNPLEEGPRGVYQLCEDLAGPQAEGLIARILATPEVPVARHFDGPRAMQNVERLLRARRRDGAR